mgnify:CR=1 FL=1
MKINILTLILIVFSPLFLLSQEKKMEEKKIKGRVIELLSGSKQDGLPGVIIKSKKSKTLARTNVDGYFEINIQYFPDTLLIENLGFNKAMVSINEPLNNLVIELKAGNQLDVVTITGKNDGKSIDLLNPFHIEQIGH